MRNLQAVPMDWSHTWYIVGLALMLVHEMDAMRCTEWRIFPGLSMLPDRIGRILFILLHIPLFLFLLAAITAPIPSRAFITGLDIFLIVHMGLHLLFLLHPKNAFKDVWSWSIIAGAALCGALDLFKGL
jgi:hypothetical protein